MAYSRRMEDFVSCKAVGSIKAGPSIIDFALFFVFFLLCHFTVIEIFPNQKTVIWRLVTGHASFMTSTEDWYIAVVAKWNQRLNATRLTSIVSAAIGKTISAVNVGQKLLIKRSVHSRTMNLYSFISPVQKGTIKVLSLACKYDCLW